MEIWEAKKAIEDIQGYCGHSNRNPYQSWCFYCDFASIRALHPERCTQEDWKQCPRNIKGDGNG